jgi:DNA-binding LacI/PurR family transcriptional regulator
MAVKTPTLSVKIANELRDDIRSGVRKPGEMLASERELAQQFLVSRPSVRKALSLLEREGWVEKKPGLGTFVKNYEKAQTHRSARVKSIALVVPNIANPFFSELAHDVERAVRQAGHQVVLVATGYQWQEESAYLQSIAQDRRIDGVLIWPIIEAGHLLAYHILDAAGIPYVLVAHDMEGIADSDMVFIDGYAGMYKAANYLLDLGHRCLAYVHALPRLYVDFRLDGCRAALRQRGLELDVVMGEALATDGGYQAGLELLSRADRPTAVLTENDAVAIGVLKAAHQLQLKIPAELSIIGFDNISVSAHLTPPLTTLDGSTYMLAKLSLLLLTERMLNRGPETKQIIKLAPTLIHRGSCAAPL